MNAKPAKWYDLIALVHVRAPNRTVSMRRHGR